MFIRRAGWIAIRSHNGLFIEHYYNENQTRPHCSRMDDIRPDAVVLDAPKSDNMVCKRCFKSTILIKIPPKRLQVKRNWGGLKKID